MSRHLQKKRGSWTEKKRLDEVAQHLKRLAEKRAAKDSRKPS
jgi:hypothetical protein